MTIDQLVDMAERIHDAEGYKLGYASTRDYRNAYWARVIGCAYHGHPKYNPTPDRQWHLKKADASRPQTDDVATSMPSRNYWDCINGVGQDGYSFGVSGHSEPLGLEQIVYAPPVPAGSAPGPQPTPVQPYPSESPDGGWWGQVADVEIAKVYAEVHRPYPSDQASLRWIGRIGYKIRDGMTKEAALADTLKELRGALGLP